MVGYRKLTIAASYMLIAVALRLSGYVPAEGFISDLTPAMVAFFGSNLAERIVDVIKGKING